MRLTKRGEKALAVAFYLLIGLGVAVIFYLSVHIHWVDDGFCFGSFVECFGEVGE